MKAGPMSALATSIQAPAARFHVGAGTHVGPVSVFPVWSEDRSNTDYITHAPKGLSVDELEVAEVGTLAVTNDSQTTVLIPEGTILFGGLQTRVLTSDVLLARGQAELVEVRCVEQGRWGRKVPTAFAGRAPITVLGALRGLHPRSHHRIRSRAHQGDVWERVASYEKTFGSRTTASLESITNFKMEDRLLSLSAEENFRAEQNIGMAAAIRNDLRKLAAHPLPGQNGVIIGLSGQPVLFEVFSNEVAFREQLGVILDAIALDAPRASGEPTPARRAVRFADHIMDQGLEVSSFSTTLLTGSNARLDTRSLFHNDERNILHTIAVNARHELVLAA